MAKKHVQYKKQLHVKDIENHVLGYSYKTLLEDLEITHANSDKGELFSEGIVYKFYYYLLRYLKVEIIGKMRPSENNLILKREH